MMVTFQYDLLYVKPIQATATLCLQELFNHSQVEEVSRVVNLHISNTLKP
jgi:hypothetical protein